MDLWLIAVQVLATLGISDFRSQFCYLRFDMPQSGLLLQPHLSIGTKLPIYYEIRVE